MDLPGAMTPQECMEELALDNIKAKPWRITYVLFLKMSLFLVFDSSFRVTARVMQ